MDSCSSRLAICSMSCRTFCFPSDGASRSTVLQASSKIENADMIRICEGTSYRLKLDLTALRISVTNSRSASMGGVLLAESAPAAHAFPVPMVQGLSKWSPIGSLLLPLQQVFSATARLLECLPLLIGNRFAHHAGEPAFDRWPRKAQRFELCP